MIRYEIYSNVASSELGLRDYPVLMDLIDSLALSEIEARFVKQVIREEDEINVAVGHFAKGVKVRGKAIKTLHPETSLKGCLAWVRSVTAKVDRGLHLNIENVRSTNGAGLILGQIHAKGQKFFLTGIDNGNWERLIAKVDTKLEKIPAEIEKFPAIKREYLARGTRPTSFYSLLGQVKELGFLPPPFISLISEMLKTRNSGDLKKLSEAQIANIGMISDVFERYQRLLEQFFEIVERGEIGGDLSAFFTMLTQGVAFPSLKKYLLPFTLENKRERIEDKRTLINEVRIGLNNGDDPLRAQFKRAFTSLLIKSRLEQDPPLFAKGVKLNAADAEEAEVFNLNREFFLDIHTRLEEYLNSGGDEDAPAPVELRQLVFELVVSLTYQGEYNVKHRDNLVPKKANLARQIISCCSFSVFNISMLRSLNPKLPVRGVASNLSKKIPLKIGEIKMMISNLEIALFPYMDMAKELSKSIEGRFKDQDAQRRSAAVAAYVNGAYPLLRNTNYVIGTAAQEPVMRAAALAAGRQMGLSVLSSRDQIKNPEALAKLQQDPNIKIEGYINLLQKEESTLFPLKSNPTILSKAYRFLMTERVVSVVRRFVAKKFNYLFEKYGNSLFEVIYQHLVWDHQIPLSRYQLGMILYRHKIFDQQRLKEFGFVAGAVSKGHEGDNHWLHIKEVAEGEQTADQNFDKDSIEKEYKSALEAFNGFIGKCRSSEISGDNGQEKPLATTIADWCDAGGGDLREEEFRKEMTETAASTALWKNIQETASKHFSALIPSDVDAEAIEFTLPGPMAQLTLLRDSHPFTIEGKKLLFRLKPGRDIKPDNLDSRSKIIVSGLNELLHTTGGPKPLNQALELFRNYEKLWAAARQISMVVLLDQMLGETILTLVKRSPPKPAEIKAYPQEQVMCLGMSSSDQGKFHRIIQRPDSRDVYATLSQLASWLARFSRLRDEMEEQRDIISDILEIIASLNFSVFDAPYLSRYSAKLREMDELLNIRPEELSLEHLGKIESLARDIGKTTREIYDQERSVGLRDRWFSRITIILKKLRPTTDLTFVDKLFERSGEQGAEAEQDKEVESGDPKPAKSKGQEQYQTFSERVRNVIDYRRRLVARDVFILSPGSGQMRLTINLIDQLFRIKGLFLPILTDISGCGNFVGELRTRLPPHRLFDMNQF